MLAAVDLEFVRDVELFQQEEYALRPGSIEPRVV
jgi:hypothetical protein